MRCPWSCWISSRRRGNSNLIEAGRLARSLYHSTSARRRRSWSFTLIKKRGIWCVPHHPFTSFVHPWLTPVVCMRFRRSNTFRSSLHTSSPLRHPDSELRTRRGLFRLMSSPSSPSSTSPHPLHPARVVVGLGCILVRPDGHRNLASSTSASREVPDRDANHPGCLPPLPTAGYLPLTSQSRTRLSFPAPPPVVV